MATLQLPLRLTFMLVFLLLQTYLLLLSVYKVSQEEILARIKLLWQHWFIYWFFLRFLKRGRSPPNHITPPLPTPVQPASGSSLNQLNLSTNRALKNSGTDMAQEFSLTGKYKHAPNSTNTPEPASEITPTDNDGPSWTLL